MREEVGRSIVSDIRAGLIGWVSTSVLNGVLRNATWQESAAVGLVAACLLIFLLHLWNLHGETEKSSVLTIRGAEAAVPLLPEPKRKDDDLAQTADVAPDKLAIPPERADERPGVRLDGVDKIMFEHQLKGALDGVAHYERLSVSFSKGNDVRNGRLRPIKVRVEGWGYWAPDLYASSWEEWARFLGDLLGHVQAGTVETMPTPPQTRAALEIRERARAQIRRLEV